MRLQPTGAAHDLAVQRVLDTVLNLYDDRLVHLVADDDAFPDLPPATRLAGAGLRGRCAVSHGVLLHDADPVDSRSPAWPCSDSAAAAVSSVGAADRPSSRSRRMV